MISSHLPALQVVIPLLAGPLCVLLRRPRLVWALSGVVSWCAFIIACRLLARVLDTGPISYAMGGWAAPWGIEYRIDEISALVLVIVSAISSVAIVYARDSIAGEMPENRIYIFYTGWMLCLTGLLGMTATGDAFNVFVFLEISSLSSYLLISLSNDPRALTAAFRYLVLGTVGATFILIGIAFLYMMTGTLNMLDLAERLNPVLHTRTVAMAFAFLAVGIGIKAAVFPLHSWLPNAYAYAPAAVTVFLAGTATKVAVYLFLRFYLTIFGAGFSFAQMRVDWLLIIIGLAASISMSLVALYQDDVKRMLAYSSIAQIGYMVLGIGIATVTGIAAGILHLFNHALMKAALFMALGCVMYSVGSVKLDNMAGIGRSMPFTMAAFVVGGLSLVGVPLTVGFISKWYLILAALEGGHPWIALLVVVSSLIALMYVWRVVEVAYFKPPSGAAAQTSEAPWTLLGPTWLLIALNIYFGIDASFTSSVAVRASRLLLGVAQ